MIKEEPEVRADEAAEQGPRLRRLRAAMVDRGLDVLVAADSGAWFTPTGSTRYLTGFSLGPMPGVVTGTVVVVPLAAPPVLVVPQGPLGCFATWARSHPLVQDVQSDPGGGLAGHLLEDVVAAVRRNTGPRPRIGIAGAFERSAGLADLLPDADVVDTAVVDGGGVSRDLVERLRAVKSPWEVGQLRHAQQCAETGMAAYCSAVAPGRRLAQAAAEADAAAVRAGADEQLTIMNSGVDPWMWWHAQGERRFEAGRVVTLETNARYRGYVAQYARATTLGPADAAQQRLLATARDSVTAMVEHLAVGVTGEELWRAGFDVVRSAGSEAWGRFGHGTGLSADEGIAVARGDDNVVAEGTCLVLHASLRDPITGESALVGEQYAVLDGRVTPLSSAPDQQVPRLPALVGANIGEGTS